MTFKGKVRLMVNMERFINSGMLHKGYYYVRVEVNPRFGKVNRRNHQQEENTLHHHSREHKYKKGSSASHNNSHSSCSNSNLHHDGSIDASLSDFHINSFILHSSKDGRSGKYDANHVNNNSASDFSVRFVDSTAIITSPPTPPNATVLSQSLMRNGIDLSMNQTVKEETTRVYNNSKLSQVFYIRYREQEVLLNEVFIFDFTADIAILLKHNLIDIDFQLFHLPKDKEEVQREEKKFEKAMHSNKYEYKIKQLDVNDFVKVADRTITIRKAMRGYNIAYPAIFENWYYSIVKSSIHCVMIDVSYGSDIPRSLEDFTFLKNQEVVASKMSCSSPVIEIEENKDPETEFDETWFSNISSYEKNLIKILNILFPSLLKRNRRWKKKEIVAYTLEITKEILNCLMGSRISLMTIGEEKKSNNIDKSASTMNVSSSTSISVSDIPELNIVSPTDSEVPPSPSKKVPLSGKRRKSYSDIHSKIQSLSSPVLPTLNLSTASGNTTTRNTQPPMPTTNSLRELASTSGLSNQYHHILERKENKEVEQFLDELSALIESVGNVELIPDLIITKFTPILESIEDLWYCQQNTIVNDPKTLVDNLEKHFIQRFEKFWNGDSDQCNQSVFGGSIINDPYPEKTCITTSIDNLIDNNLFFYPRFSKFSLISEVSEPAEPLFSVADIMGDDLEPQLIPKDEYREIEKKGLLVGEKVDAGALTKNHLIIFIPGYKSSHYDFVTFKTILGLHFPDDRHQFYIVKSLDKLHTKDTSSELHNAPIKIMAKLVTDEITQMIQENEIFFHKVSFICHSLGGIIMRSAFYYFRPSWKTVFPYLHTFVSLSVPHLGIGPIKTLINKDNESFASNNLVRAGIWFLKSFKKEKCLQELSMEDHSDVKDSKDNKTNYESHKLEQCLLFKLSMTNDLSWFKQVLLIGSEQDTYVPIESALIWSDNISFGKKSNKKKSSKDVLERMISNLQETFSYVKIIRCKCDMSNLFSKSEKKEYSSVQVFNKKHNSGDLYEDVSSIGTYSFMKPETGDDSSEDEKEEAFDGSKKKKINASIIDRMTKKMNHTAYLNHVGLINGICCAFRSYLD
ncbi:predicted protein [Naegleria gruberi]|uniref:Predicted protein n=1 Tax=Naegleria gruberi TaxID=5762 RepID=D2VZI8_NAEGR|nr:uncharacterized protein NAEGRDRAFT_53507 [Naegleria gruberi]EFC37854.1 predicted protein [Naegleria gruberi]|eukprot:XP_002670598.1 predicted protein [Naegleria gruberi strain NEG-M]